MCRVFGKITRGCNYRKSIPLNVILRFAQNDRYAGNLSGITTQQARNTLESDNATFALPRMANMLIFLTE